MCFCCGGNSSGHCYKDARREGRGCSLGAWRGDTRSEKGGRSLSPHLILPLLPFVFSSGFLLPLPCLQTSTSPSFLSHACLQVVFNGQLTMSRGQRRKRKYFPVGAISHWRGGTFLTKGSHPFSCLCPLSSQKRTYPTEMIVQNYILIIKVMCILVGATKGLW